jgi:hypothetical protein
VQQEQQRPVGHAGQAGAEAAGEAFLLVLGLANFLFDLLPVHAKGRVGEHVVELLAGEAVFRQRIAPHDVLRVLALDEHVRLADGVGLVIQLLAEHAGERRDLCSSSATGHQLRACRRCRQWGRTWSGRRRFVLKASSSRRRGRWTIRRIDFAGCEVFAGSLVGDSANLRMSSSNARPIWSLGTAVRVQVDRRTSR